ncbi:MAG: PHP domain-containing protein [Leptolyngbyaceae cyanobacterium SL_7_1]|nr:PHP domain-containing protein [Leptolyngbyaceae cyanobacterium SL_7_1]
MSLAAQDAAALRQVFAAITVESCPASYNFHMHTVHSDGQFQPEALIQQAIAIGLQGFAITDHHSVGGYRVAQRWLEDQLAETNTEDRRAYPRLWTGAEINAELLGIEVHVLAYAFDPTHVELQPYLQSETVKGEGYQAQQVIAAIHQAGGLAVLAHPARYRRSHKDLIPAAAALGIDGVETYYAYNNPSPWRASPKESSEIKHLSETHGLLNTCGTDTHGLSLLQRL